MKIKNQVKGVTLVELMTVLAIIVIAVGVGGTVMRSGNARNELINQLKLVRSSFILAKATALEHTVSVRMTVEPNKGVTVVSDQDRDGSFSNGNVIIGHEIDGSVEGQESFYRKVLVDNSQGVEPLLFWFQGEDFSGTEVSTFPSNTLIISPDGRVYSEALQPTSGTFFFVTDDAENYGAVHITAMGEVKIATRRALETEGDFNGWKWSD